ncbi:MAG TPA: TldD/PmbA family protein [Acidimicrobiales bacterium]|nr:TldD/PmbA family protein [Acidimicrobiales bacterium]
MSGTDLADVADRLVAMAEGGEQVEAYVARSSDTQVRVYQGEVEQLSMADTLGVGVRVVRDGRQGFAYCGTFDPAALAETVAEARDNARYGEPDEAAGLPEPDGVAPADLDLWRPGLAEVPTADKVALAVELERAVLAADPRITGVESCDYGDSRSEAAIATTTGIRRATRESGCSLVAYSLAGDGDDTQTGFGFSLARTFDELDAAVAARDAADRALRMLGATKPPSGRLTVVLDPWVTAQLVGIVADTLGGEEVIKGRSLFAGRVAEQVASPLVTLVEDATDPASWNATPIDAEGLATRRVPLIASGVLQGFLHSTWTARRMGTVSTGSAVRAGFKSTPTAGSRAVALTPGTAGGAALVAGVEDGVLVQEVSGLHSGVNPVSGDLSTGAEGLRIRGGELAEPLREFTIASTLQRLLHDVVAVGSDLTWLPMNAAGMTLVIGDVAVSGS